MVELKQPISFYSVQVGDTLIRKLSPYSEQRVTVIRIVDSMIICQGNLIFDRLTGAEIDPSRGWGRDETWSILDPFKRYSVGTVYAG